MPKEQFRTTIIITDTKKLHSGDNKGVPFTLWQVIATKVDGTVIPQAMNLRTFEDLPKGVPTLVDAKLFTSPKYGSSYTLTSAEGQPEAATKAAPAAAGLGALEVRVRRIEDFLKGRGEFVGSAMASRERATQTAPASAPPPPPPVPPDQAAPSQAGPPQGPIPSDGDIPF